MKKERKNTEKIENTKLRKKWRKEIKKEIKFKLMCMMVKSQKLRNRNLDKEKVKRKQRIKKCV